MDEQLLKGAKRIYAYLGWSRSKFYSVLPELISSTVVFKMWLDKPPREYLCSYPSRLQIWISKKAEKGESL